MSYYGDSASEKAAMRLEAKIKRIYAEAARDVEQKILHYTDTFKKRDAEMQKKLKNGEISQADYDNWKSRIVFRGKRWNNVRDTIWLQLYHTRQTTTDMINDERKAMFQNVVNYSQYQIDKDFNFSLSFNIYDNATVTRLIKKDPDLVPDVKYPVPGRDYAWSKKQIASAATQGVIQGESIPEISRRIANKLSSANMVSMTRCARTAMTGAHNSGRIEAMHNAEDLGIKVQKLWIATLDSRTRDWHRDLDGQLAEVDEPFYSHFGEIMYPGDPNARPANVWNCRCSLGWEYPEYKNQYDTRAARDEDPESDTFGKTIEVKDMTYREWERMRASEIPNNTLKVTEQPDLVEETDGLNQETFKKEANRQGSSLTTYDIEEYVASSYGAYALGDKISKFIDNAPEEMKVGDEVVYRGLGFDSKSEYDAFLRKHGIGKVIETRRDGLSWTTDESVAEDFSLNASDYSVIMVCEDEVKNAISISGIADTPQSSSEVLYSNSTDFEVLRIEKKGNFAYVYVKEYLNASKKHRF